MGTRPSPPPLPTPTTFKATSETGGGSSRGCAHLCHVACYLWGELLQGDAQQADQAQNTHPLLAEAGKVDSPSCWRGPGGGGANGWWRWYVCAMPMMARGGSQSNSLEWARQS